jgi:hypothetical protein
VAITPSGESDALTVPIQARSIKAAIPAVRLPSLFVLAIGVSEYKQASYRLQLAHKDANDFADVMQAQAGKVYASVEVRRLINSQATKQRVLDELQWLGRAAQDGDVTMLFIAGHGVSVDHGLYYFLPVDGHVDPLGSVCCVRRRHSHHAGQRTRPAWCFL